jgi:hypothetical protein
LTDDYIIRCGDVGREMFFLLHGMTVAVGKDESKVFSVMHEGAFFGEIALLCDELKVRNQ